MPEILILSGIIFFVFLFYFALIRNMASSSVKKPVSPAKIPAMRKKIKEAPNNIFEILLADISSRGWGNIESAVMRKFIREFLKHEFILIGNTIEKEPNPGPFVAVRKVPLKRLAHINFITGFTSETFRINFAPDMQDACWLYRKTGSEFLHYVKQVMQTTKEVGSDLKYGFICNGGTDQLLLWRDDQLEGFAENIDKLEKEIEEQDRQVEKKPKVIASNVPAQIEYDLPKNTEERYAKKGQTVRFKTREETPREITAELNKYLASVPEIMFAYICSIQLDAEKGWHYVVGIETEKQDSFRRNQIISEMSIIVKKYIKDSDYIDLITLGDNSVYSKHLRTFNAPFYTRADILDLTILDSPAWKVRYQEKEKS